MEEQVKRVPDNVALVFENSHLTYSELNRKSNQLARILRYKGVRSDVIVGIVIERSFDMIIGIMGILKAGGAYLPIDHEYPKERVKQILEDTSCEILLTQQSITSNISFMGIKNIKNKTNKIFYTGQSLPISNLDSLPYPDRSLIDYEKYQDEIGLVMVKNCIVLQATRGCPYDCAYCSKIWTKKHKVRSAEHIFNEMKIYYDIGIKRFAFIDDIFNLDIENSSKFFNLIIQNNMDVH